VGKQDWESTTPALLIPGGELVPEDKLGIRSPLLSEEGNKGWWIEKLQELKSTTSGPS
jgi:hypothetical protein